MISLRRAALELCPAPNLHQSGTFNNLAYALCARFKQLGRLEDLEEAISIYRDALDLRVEPHPERPGCLSNLANTPI